MKRSVTPFEFRVLLMNDPTARQEIPDEAIVIELENGVTLEFTSKRTEAKAKSDRWRRIEF